jgi:alpha-mannosidase
MMRWELALAQHPMYLLIREDTTCAERTPPWGAPTIEAYIERIRENLAALERYPRLKLGYEWSGVELELLAQDAPDVIQSMRSYAREGRIQFYNGTYAQPHLQILSSESNLRQFQFGKRVYQELGLDTVTVYAHQEASVHDQVPQLLLAFGIPYAVVPGFLTNLVWLDEGEMLLHGVRGPRFLKDRQFASWLGLDGSRVPLYLHQPIPREMTLKETLAREFVLGRLNAPSLFIDLPDMIGLDDAWMNERSTVDFVTLETALIKRLEKNLESPRVRLFTNWSYLEGIRAEELSRYNWQAEHEALRADALNSLAYALTQRTPESMDEIWKTILKCQHHDVYCFSAPELRAKSISWLRDAAVQSKKRSDEAVSVILPQIQTNNAPGQPIVVINPLPHSQVGLVETTTLIENPKIFNGRDEHIPCETLEGEDGYDRVRFLTTSKGFGYTVYWIRRSEEQNIQPNAVVEPFEFENASYRAMIRPDGAFTSLVVKPCSRDLIDSARGFGNSLSATDSSTISLNEETPEQRVERYLSDPPTRGPQLDWILSGSASVRETPLGRVFSVAGKMGEQIRADLTLHFYHQLSRIDLTWDFHFDMASIGTFFDDESKLLARWPLAIESKIYHDIPFGVILEREDRPFFPTSWVDLSDGMCGLAFFHRGTPKHWVCDRTLFNLIAWGEQTDAIHNGLGRYQWLKSFDQRLDGHHTIHLAIYPHTGDWRSADIPRAAREYGFPPVAYPANRQNGTLPSSQSLIELVDPSISTTSVRTIGDNIICRVFAGYGRDASTNGVTQGLRPVDLRLIDGSRVEKLHPYQIGELILEVGKFD